MSSTAPRIAASMQNHPVQAVPRWKRCLDVCIILFLLPVLVPLCLLIAIYIKVVSPGPIFFYQKRIGLGQQPFICMKFRSMHENADSNVHQKHLETLIKNKLPLNKIDSRKPDARVIPFGNLLRSSGFDELPQLINVWRGEMSVVGPRPCTLYEYEQYEPWQMERFNALPGLTGLWQVNGKNHTTFDEMIGMDIDYTRRFSPLVDMAIIIKTFPVLIHEIVAAVMRKLRSPVIK